MVISQPSTYLICNFFSRAKARMPSLRKQTTRGAHASVFTVPERYPATEAEFRCYQKIVATTGGKHDGWEAAPAERLYYWWAYYPDATSARKGVAALKKMGYQSTSRHPAPFGKKPAYPPNMPAVKGARRTKGKGTRRKSRGR
jgi:hypothetical protein